MKIEIDVPDRAKNRRITIFAGLEMVAYHDPFTDHWVVIEEGCSRCGECCADNGPGWIYYDKDKGCKYLIEAGGKNKVCELGAYRPFGCSDAIPTERDRPEQKDVVPPEVPTKRPPEVEGRICELGVFRPFGCSAGTGEVESCTIKTRKVIKVQR